VALLRAVGAEARLVLVEGPCREAFMLVAPDGVQEPSAWGQVGNGVNGEYARVNKSLNF